MGGNESFWQVLASPTQLELLEQTARQRRWGLALLLIGWLHLFAFSFCFYLTSLNYNEPPGYLAVWVSELCGVGLILRLCAGSAPAGPADPLARFLVRVWTSYFLLAFNLGTMNTLAGYVMFRMFPAMASLASFAFLVMTFSISRWFFLAVLVQFAAGLLMASFFLHAYLIFALAWWIVLQGIGLSLLQRRNALSPVIPGRA